MRFRKCPLCDADDTDVLDEIRFVLPERYHLPDRYSISVCNKCGFCYADTRATLDDYNNYYTTCNIYSGAPVGIGQWSKLHKTALKMLEKCVDKNDFMLDMGFGKGNFMRCLKTEGYTHICGIDPSQESVDSIRMQKIGEAHVGSIFDEPDENNEGKYKCVFLFDVIEHLLYPQQAVKNLIKYVEADGYILISVPNYASLGSNNTPIPNVFNQEHINYFSLTSLDNIMANNGMCRVAANLTQEDVEDEIIALYCKTAISKGYKKDIVCSNAIRQYLFRSMDDRDKIEEKLARLHNEGKTNLYVWGTGAYTMWLLANTSLGGFLMEFIDNNEEKIGKNFYKDKIKSPKSVTDENKPIVVCSMLYADAIEEQIHQMNLRNEILKL